MEAAQLTPPQKALLQLLIAKRVLTETEAQKALETIDTKYELGVAGDDLTTTFRDINKSLKYMNLEVRSMQSGSDERVHAVINLAGDEVAEKYGTALTQLQIDVFKKAMHQIGESSDGRTNFDKFKGPEQRTLEHLVHQKWLTLQGGALRIGPRAHLELGANLEEAGIARTQVIYH